MSSYSERVASELESFAEFEEVSALPASHDYTWGKFLMPLMVEVGLDGGLLQFWDDTVAERCAARAPEMVQFFSVGAGQGENEIALAQRLAERGHTNLELVFLELNADLIAQSLEAAAAAGLGDRTRAEQVDLNAWDAGDVSVDIYFANHSLHHIVELEAVYAEIARTLRPDGVFLVNDMIGRNGHQRWPEAVSIINELWAKLPEKYRRNRSVGGVDDVYPDLDCSGVGFEGIRSQDVLPLLLDAFEPETFVAFGNLVDPFIDRIYGFNIDLDDAEDRKLLDGVAQLDDAAIDLGIVTPTHLIASFRNVPTTARYPRDRSPQRMVRDPQLVTPSTPVATPEAAAPAAAAAGDARVAELEARLADAEGRYAHLRNRKVVKLGLQLAELRHKVGGRRGRAT